MRIFLLSILILTSPLSYAGSQGSGDASLDDFFQHYINSYGEYMNSESPDINSLLAHFHEPLIQLPPNSPPITVKQRSDFAKRLAGFVAMLEGKGAVGLKWETLQVVKLTDTTAFASNIASVLDKQGKTIERRGSLYSLRLTEGKWTIAMAQPLAADTVPTLIRAKAK